VRIPETFDYPTLRVNIDRAKALQLGISENLAAALMGGFAITIGDGSRSYRLHHSNGWTVYRRGFTVSRRCWFGGVRRSLRTGAFVAAASTVRRSLTRTDPG
jgi:hypothetical protein